MCCLCIHLCMSLIAPPPSVPVSQKVLQIVPTAAGVFWSQSRLPSVILQPHLSCSSALREERNGGKLPFPGSTHPFHTSPRCPGDSRPAPPTRAACWNNSGWYPHSFAAPSANCPANIRLKACLLTAQQHWPGTSEDKRGVLLISNCILK